MPPPQIKPVSESLAALLEDSVEGARNEAATCLGTLMKMVGERPLNALMDGLADVRKAKVKEAYEKATVKCKAGGAPKPAPPAAKEAPKKKPLAAKKVEPPTDMPLADEEAPPPELKPMKKPPARLLVCGNTLSHRLLNVTSSARQRRHMQRQLVVAKEAHQLPLLLLRRNSLLMLQQRPSLRRVWLSLQGLWILSNSSIRQKMLTHLQRK